MNKNDKVEPYVRYFEESVFSRMLKIISMFNDMEKEKVIDSFVIGGATALTYYSAPIVTEDVDIFFIPISKSLFIDISPVYNYIKSHADAKEKGEFIVVDGIPVQLLTPHDDLHKEAYEHCIQVSENGKKFKVFSIEYLMAIMIQLGKMKYKYRLSTLGEDEYDSEKLKKILKKYNLSEKWEKIKNEF